MNEKAEVINLERVETAKGQGKQLRLDSGRQIRISSDAHQELVEIVEPEGEVVMQVRLTEEGPVVSVRGARLELQATDTLTLEAQKVNIKSRQDTVIKSEGRLEIDTSEKLNIRAADDIRMRAKTIHLN